MVAQAILAAFTIFKVVTSKANPKTGLAFLSHDFKNGGGGENRTRVQRSREAGIYKFSLIFPQSPFGPLMMAQTASRDRDYVLAGASNR